MSDNLVFLEYGSFSVYWYGVFAAVAVFLAAVVFSALRRLQGKSFLSGLTLALVAMPPALVCARIFYCWFGKASFAGGIVDCFELWKGGYALYGALAGVLAVMGVYARLFGEPLPELLDAAAPAVSLATAVGRFASRVSGDDIGFELTSGNAAKLPFAVWSEADHSWILWVGYFEGLFAVLAFVFTAAVFVMKYRLRFRGMRSGSAILIYMLVYGYSQAILESMRNDSLFMVTLGFVRISQIISIVMAVAATVILSVQICRASGARPLQMALWGMAAVALGAAVYCEFEMNALVMVQNYIIMGISLAFLLGMSVYLFFYNASVSAPLLAEREAKRKAEKERREKAELLQKKQRREASPRENAVVRRNVPQNHVPSSRKSAAPDDGFDDDLGSLDDGFDDDLGSLDNGFDDDLGGLENGFDDDLGSLDDRPDDDLGGLDDRFDDDLGGLDDGFDDDPGGLDDDLGGLDDGFDDDLDGLNEGLDDDLGGLDDGFDDDLGGLDDDMDDDYADDYLGRTRAVGSGRPKERKYDGIPGNPPRRQTPARYSGYIDPLPDKVDDGYPQRGRSSAGRR